MADGTVEQTGRSELRMTAAGAAFAACSSARESQGPQAQEREDRRAARREGRNHQALPAAASTTIR